MSKSDKAAESHSHADATTLVGSWVVFAIDGDSVLEDHPPTLDFGADGRVSGTTGCNLFHAPWELEDGQLSIGPIGLTMRMCEEVRMEQEASVLQVFADTTGATVTVEGDELSLVTPGSHRFDARRTQSNDSDDND